ncbi:MAG: BON domain-containing protein [Pseudomonadota bacterium]
MNALKILTISTLLALAAGPVLADKSAGETLDDSLIQTEVKAKILGEDFGEGAGVNLETRKGVVQLGGFIDDVEVGNRLTEVAATVDGVVSVDNQLHPKQGNRSAGRSIDDRVATTRVKSAITSADFGDGVAINVDTYNGVVLLTGFTNTEDSKDRAGELAAAVENVDEVINGVHVMD